MMQLTGLSAAGIVLVVIAAAIPIGSGLHKRLALRLCSNGTRALKRLTQSQET